MPLPGSDQTPAQVLQDTEAKWAAAIHSTATGTTRLRSDTSDSLPSWMLPSQSNRLHWSQRQQQRQEQQQQQQQQQQPQPQLLPTQQATADDTIDVLGACGSHPQQTQWRHLWELASASHINRQHRILWWRILHGCLMCGAYKAYIHRATPQQQLPAPMLPRFSTAADYQPHVPHLPCGSCCSQLAMQTLASHHRTTASGLSLNPSGS